MPAIPTDPLTIPLKTTVRINTTLPVLDPTPMAQEPVLAMSLVPTTAPTRELATMAPAMPPAAIVRVLITIPA
jgi:hypothetical protein